VGQPDVAVGDVANPPGFAEPSTLAAASSARSSAQELLHLTPPRVAQPDVEVGDETPTPREAAQRLARFVDEVQVERESPLIASPPRQRARSRGPPSIRQRSRRIAAQPLAYRPPVGERYSSTSGWISRHRPSRLHLRPREYLTPCVLGS
jgi:hypothetical protein